MLPFLWISFPIFEAEYRLLGDRFFDLTAEAEDLDLADRVVGDAEGLVTLEATGGTMGEGFFVFSSK